MAVLNPPTHMFARPAVAQIAGYDVVKTLGTGAASVLYLVHDRQGTTYTLKHVPVNGKQDHRFVDQAMSEHDIAQRFDDPRIRKSLRVHKIRPLMRIAGVAVILEHVDGQTLDKHASAPSPELYRIFYETAAALDVMHQAGYVHADLKPANILVTQPRKGQAATVKLIDLGQSCPAMTVKKRVQGTPDYMAPEQAKRRFIDARTDVYGLAATIYDLLTGKKATRGVTAKTDRVGTLASHDDDAKTRAPAHELNPAVGPALSTLLSDCLATRPNDRPASMSRVMERLSIAIDQQRRAAG